MNFNKYFYQFNALILACFILFFFIYNVINHQKSKLYKITISFNLNFDKGFILAQNTKNILINVYRNNLILHSDFIFPKSHNSVYANSFKSAKRRLELQVINKDKTITGINGHIQFYASTDKIQYLKYYQEITERVIIANLKNDSENFNKFNQRQLNIEKKDLINSLNNLKYSSLDKDTLKTKTYKITNRIKAINNHENLKLGINSENLRRALYSNFFFNQTFDSVGPSIVSVFFTNVNILIVVFFFLFLGNYFFLKLKKK